MWKDNNGGASRINWRQRTTLNKFSPPFPHFPTNLDNKDTNNKYNDNKDNDNKDNDTKGKENNNKDNDNEDNNNKDNDDKDNQNFWSDIFKEWVMYRWQAGNKLAKLKSHQAADTSIASTLIFTCFSNWNLSLQFFSLAR